ncbi:MAG: TauD/TfdA family dioxygenase [Rhizobiales bacterium]|nr:TauD/TfdA family dioxygenase [Hyphomicrobiales bacterium]
MIKSGSSFRTVISGPFAWTGAQASGDPSWICDVTGSQQSVIEAGIETFARLGLPWQSATRGNLPLAGIEDLFARIRQELEEGTGLFRLRGLPVARHSMEHLKAFYLSFGEHLGQPVSQSVSGQRLMDIEDEGAKSKHYGMIDTDGGKEGFRSSRARAFSTGGLRFHTDRCDVVSLMCIRQASQGGHSKIASAVAIHNAMLERRPDLLEELFTPYPRSRFGEEVNDASAYYMLPVFAQHDGKFTTHYSRTYIEAAQSNCEVPRLRNTQNEALDLLAELANELCFEMTLQPGDIQLLNNHVVYHARDPFVDNAAVGQKRLLFRLWLAMGNSRPLPESYQVLFGHTAPGAVRGGIWPPDRAYQLPL